MSDPHPDIRCAADDATVRDSEIRRSRRLVRTYSIFMVFTATALFSRSLSLMSIGLGVNLGVWCMAVLCLRAEVRHQEKMNEEVRMKGT